MSEKCEVGTANVLCQVVRIIPYYIVHVLFGTAIPTSIIHTFISVVFYSKVLYIGQASSWEFSL